MTDQITNNRDWLRSEFGDSSWTGTFSEIAQSPLLPIYAFEGFITNCSRIYLSPSLQFPGASLN